MKKEFYKIIKFPFSDTKNGILFMYQKKEVPFLVRKTLLIKGMISNDKRGGHTHHKTNQILICVSGGCKVSMDNGENKAEVVLNKTEEGLLLYPYVWHTMYGFKPNTILLVLADRKYNEKEYIRNYEDFIKIIKNKKL